MPTFSDVGNAFTTGVGDLFHKTKNIVTGDPFGDKDAAQQQEEAAKQAQKAQLEYAAQAQARAEANAAKGIALVGQGTEQGASALQGYAGAAQGTLNHSSLNANRAYSLGGTQAINRLGAAGDQARTDVGQLTALQGYAGQATGAVDSGGRMDALANGGLAAGFQADPGYQFRQQQGEQALNRSAAAQGGRLGGAQLQALANFNSGLASQEFGNYADRAIGMAGQADQSQLQAGLAAQGNAANLAGMGYGAQTTLADLAMQTGAGQAAAGQSAANAIGGQFGQAGSQAAGMQQATGSQLGSMYAGMGTAQGALAAGASNPALQQSTMQALAGTVPYAGGATAAQGNSEKQIGTSILGAYLGKI